MKSQAPSGQVRVGVVVRPLLPHEKEQGAENCVKVVNGKKVTFTHHPGNITGIATSSIPQFDYDRAFAAAGTSQHKSIYNGLIAPLVDNVFEGYSATVFAYGQTGSGKTFVMGNGSGGNNTEGIISSTVKGIFEKKSELETTGSIVTLDMSYLEIYKEECFDLLAEVVGGGNNTGGGDSSRNRLEMRDNTRGETVIEGLCSVTVTSEDDVHRLLELAAAARSTSKTAMNARSSRSHAIATFHVKIVTTTTNADVTTESAASAVTDDQPMAVAAATTTLTLCSKMHLVDLAGSERVKKTLAAGETLQEGISINQSLLALGNVVAALTQQQQPQNNNGGSKKNHVPYRESKLTRLLKDALGGHGMTVLLACCSPADSNFDETLNTLRFASRASSIVNDAKAHRDVLTTSGQGLVPFLCAHCGELNEPASSSSCVVPALGSATSSSSVTILQEHLVSTLQIKCEVLIAQLEMARGALAESSGAAVALVPVLLGASARMSSSLRAMLILCLEEGVEVGDAELQSLRDDLKTLRVDLSLPDDNYTPEPVEAAGDAQMFADLMSGMPAEWLADGAAAKGCFDCYTPPILLLCDEVARFESDVMARRDQLLREAAASTQNHRTDGGQRCSVGSALSASSSSGSSMMLVAAAAADHMDDSAGGAAVASTTNKRGQKRKKDAAGEGETTARTKQTRLGESTVPPRLSTSSMSSSGSDNDGLLGASSSGGDVDDAEGLDAMLDGISRKELQVTEILEASRSYERTIRELKDEIRQLQQDRVKLSQQQQQVDLSATNTTNANTNATNGGTRLRKELEEKSSALTDKLKLLRLKEIEFRKLSLQKDKAAKEAAVLRAEMEHAKRSRNLLQRRLKDEGQSHNAEKKRLEQQELQSRHREQSAQRTLARIEEQLQKKERVWKAQLEEKDRENKQLRDLVARQESVAAHRKAFAHSGPHAQGSSSSSASSQPSASADSAFPVPPHRAAELVDWIKTEAERATLTTDVRVSTEARVAVERRLTQVKTVPRPDDIKVRQLEAMVKQHNAAIARKQGRLAELSATINGANPGMLTDNGGDGRFDRFSLAEAKVLLSALFKQATTLPAAAATVTATVTATAPFKSGSSNGVVKSRLQALHSVVSAAAATSSALVRPKPSTIPHAAVGNSQRPLVSSTSSSSTGIPSATTGSTSIHQRPTISSSFKGTALAVAARPATAGRVPLGSKIASQRPVGGCVKTQVGMGPGSHAERVSDASTATAVTTTTTTTSDADDAPQRGETAEDEEGEDSYGDEDMDVDESYLYNDDNDESFYPEEEDDDDDDDDHYRRKAAATRRRQPPKDVKGWNNHEEDEEEKVLPLADRLRVKFGVTFGSSSGGSALATAAASEASTAQPVSTEADEEEAEAKVASSSSGDASKSKQRGNNGTKASSKAPKAAKAKACKPLHACAPPPVLTAITRTSLEGYTIKELKGLLAERRLPVSGKKSELVERLEDYLEDQEQEDEEEEDSDEEEEEGSEEEEDGDKDENENRTVVNGQEPAIQKQQQPPPRKVVLGRLGPNNTFGLSLALHSPGRWDRDNADTEEYM